MTKAGRQFILEKLIPFVEREHGNGFAMSQWHRRYLTPGTESMDFDDVFRICPVDGSVCCLGGSIAVLLGRPAGFDAAESPELAAALSLTIKQAAGLFLNWRNERARTALQKYCWPRKYRNAYQRANTPAAKAAVAVRLLRQLAAEGGQILRNPDYKRAK